MSVADSLDLHIRTGRAALGAQRLNAIIETEHPDAMAFWPAAGYEMQTARSRFVKNLP